MMNDIVRDRRGQQLILSSGKGMERSRDYRLQMLVNNSIKGLLTSACSEIDGELYIYYNTADKYSFREYFGERRVDGKFFRMLFEGMLEVREELEKYLIGPDYLMLSPDDIFVDVLGREVGFVCYPFEDMAVQEKMLQLSEYLLSKLKLNDTEAIYYGYAFYQICAEKRVTADSIRRILKENPDGSRKSDDEEKKKGSTVYEDGNNKGEEKSLWDEFFEEEEKINRKKEEKEKKTAEKKKNKREKKNLKEPSGGKDEKKQSELFSGLKSIFVKKERKPQRGDYEFEDWMKNDPAEGFARASVVIGVKEEGRSWEKGRKVQEGEKTSYARLIPAAAGDSIVLKDMRYIIGKECAGADIVSSSAKVSRIHARLVRGEGSYLLSDMDSKNGTFVNEKRLMPGMQKKLSDRDRIRFGDVEYVFRKK